MNLGVLLSLGDSLDKQEKSGQFSRFEEFYLEKYAKNFEKVFLFSYGKDFNFSKNKIFELVSNNTNLHRFVYTFILPFLAFKKFKKNSVFRVMQVTGAIPAVIGKIFYKIPFIATYGYKYHKFAEIEGRGFSSPFLKLVELIVLKTADGVIVTTEELRKYVEKFTKPMKVFLIANGVETKMFFPIPKGFDSRNIKILSIGRLEVQKNYLNLIKAISLSKYKKNIILTIIGNGSLKNQLGNLAKKLSVNLKIIDFVPHNLLPRYYQDADIFILPSLAEGQPKVLLEAQSTGLPVIASKVQGTIELVKDYQTGLLCSTDSEGIAKKLDTLIGDHSLREKIGKDGRNFILKNHDLEKLVTKEIEILRKFAQNA